MLTCIVLFIRWYGIVVSSSEEFIWIDLAHAQTCLLLKNKIQLSLDDLFCLGVLVSFLCLR